MDKQVKIIINGKAVSAPVGTRLSDLLHMDMPCGGKGTCGKCRVAVNGREELACRYILSADAVVEIPQAAEILSETGISADGTLTENLCFALDVGTTTLALALISLDEKKVVKVLTATNPQRQFGADVITRIDYCQKHGVTALQRVLVEEINRMITAMGATADIMYVSANTTMLHTLFGVDCSTIGVAPYTPAFLGSKLENGDLVGIRGVKTVISLPSVSAFVGADIVAGLHLIGLPPADKYNLLIDLGTNAEIVLYTATGGVAAAAAAGPCFEGANIICGMNATAGAICAFSLDYGHASLKTVADDKPRGICGTGLVDIVAALLKNDMIDETGYMSERYVLAEGVYLTPEDVRQYQLAKSAVCSAIKTLMMTESVDASRISGVYISGGFSSKINIANAVLTGLLPRDLAAKAVPLGNSSLQGTAKYAAEGGVLSRFTDKIRYVDLSSDPCFAKLFVDNMTFLP